MQNEVEMRMKENAIDTRNGSCTCIATPWSSGDRGAYEAEKHRHFPAMSLRTDGHEQPGYFRLVHG